MIYVPDAHSTYAMCQEILPEAASSAHSLNFRGTTPTTSLLSFTTTDLANRRSFHAYYFDASQSWLTRIMYVLSSHVPLIYNTDEDCRTPKRLPVRSNIPLHVNETSGDAKSLHCTTRIHALRFVDIIVWKCIVAD